MTTEPSLTVYQTLEASRDNPDAGPTSPAAEGSWTWWRTGPHPQGVWQAMDWTPEFNDAYLKNRAEFPIHQDGALGPPSDFGNRVCHACNYLSEGYPEAAHFTNCDGVCRRSNCRTHTPLKESEPAHTMTPFTPDERATLEDILTQLTWAAKALKDPGPEPRSQDFWDAQTVVAQSARKLKGLLDL